MFKKKLASAWKAIAGATVASVIAAGTLAGAALPAAAATADVQGATFTWGLRGSFISYLATPFAGGSTTASGNVTGSAPFVWSAGTGTVQDTTNGDADVHFNGGLRFTGHSGELDVTLANPRVDISGTTGTLYLDADSKGYNASPGLVEDGVAFATFTVASANIGSDAITIAGSEVKLTAKGVDAFAGFYQAGDLLDDFSLELPYTYPAAATGISATFSNSSVEVGDEVTITANVTPQDAPGSVEFLLGSEVLATVTTTGGTASYTTSAFTEVDGHTIVTVRFVPENPDSWLPSEANAPLEVVAPVEETPTEEPADVSVEVFLADGITAYTGQPLAAGDELVVRGSGFLPAGEATTGKFGPFAGHFTGSYVILGDFADDWKPSEGYKSSERTVLFQKWAVPASLLPIIGGAAAGGELLNEDGTFETTLVVPDDVKVSKNFGVYTYPGGGSVYAPFETATPLTPAADEEPPAAIEVYLADGTTPYDGQELTEGDQLVVKGTGFDPAANVGGMGVPIPADQPQGTFIVFGSFAHDWRPSEGAASTVRQSHGQARAWALTQDAVDSIPERYREGIESQWVELAADGSFTATIDLIEPTDPVTDGVWGIYTYPGGVGLDPNPAQELSVPLNYTSSTQEPAEPTADPQVVVSPASGIDPTVQNTITVSGTGFHGPAAANGVYVQIGEVGKFTGNGPLPANGWLVQAWVMPNQIADGAWTTTLVVPSGGFDADTKYEVITTAAHGLSVTNRTLETFTALELRDAGAPVCEAYEVAAGSLSWGMKDSFRAYVQGQIAGGTISGAGGAAKNSAGIIAWNQAAGVVNADGTGVVEYTGSVNFTGHHGELNLTFSNPQVVLTSATSANLVFDVAGKDLSGTDIGGTGVVLATAQFPAITTNNLEVTNAATTLTEAGTQAFIGFYDAGTALDPVSFEVTLGAGTDCAQVPDEGGSAGGGDNTGGGSGVTLPVVKPAPTQPSTPAPATPEEATPTCVARAVTGATLRWGVKESFRSYIQGPVAQGSWSTSGAVSGGSPFVFSAGRGSFNTELNQGRIAFSGSVTFTGHGGQLSTTVSNPRILIHSAGSASLIVDVKAKSIDGDSINQANVAFASLRLPAAAKSGSTISYNGASATLTAAGSRAFSGFYDGGAALDPISFTIQLGGEVECDASTGSLSTTGANVDALGLMLGLMVLGGGLVVARNRRGRASA